MNDNRLLKTEKWLKTPEIQKELERVAFIILAQANIDETSSSPIHFTIFFHTSEPIIDEAIEAIKEKLAKDYHLNNIINFSATLGDVAFAKTNEPLPMPFYIKDKRKDELPEGDTIVMFIFDFDANAHKGFENIKKSMTGWSYVYED